MLLNPQHPAYDPAKELLCLLPIDSTDRGDLFAILPHVRDDLGMRTMMQVTAQVRRLREMGVGIVARNLPGIGRTLAIDGTDWGKAQSMGLEYWGRVYGD